MFDGMAIEALAIFVREKPNVLIKVCVFARRLFMRKSATFDVDL